MKIINKNRILIVTQPDYPVPPVNDGAQSIVIHDTLTNIDSSSFSTISLYTDKLESVSFDKNKFRIVNNRSIIFKILKKFLFTVKPSKYIQSSRYRDLLVGIYLLNLRNRQNVFVVHSTKMHWLLEIKRWFPKIVIISYHHSSEDQNCPLDIFKLVVEQIEGHIFVSDFGETVFREKALEVLPAKILKSIAIQNGVNLDQFKHYVELKAEWRKKYYLMGEKVTLLFAGRIIPRKGLHLLLEALGLLDLETRGQIQLVVSGGADFFKNDPTPYVQEVKNKILALKATLHISELGYIPHKQVHELFAVSDLLIFTSVEPEGSPLALIEAAASGLPVIASGIGGIDEIVEQGASGFILDTPLSSVQLAESIAMVVNDSALRERLSKNAFQISRQKFSAKRMATDFLNAVNHITHTDAD